MYAIEGTVYRLAADTLETELQRLRRDLTANREALEFDLARSRNALAERGYRGREELAAAREKIISLSSRLEYAHEELSASRSLLDPAMSLARQQPITSQRYMMELRAESAALMRTVSHPEDASMCLDLIP